VSVGNDVVDLDDRETRLEALHPRWAERVFTAAERRALAATATPRGLHWALWAAKESAYKVRKRLDPGAVFAPRAFEVELAALPARRGSCRGSVRHGDDVFTLEVRLDDSYVHAVAALPGRAGLVVSRVEPAPGAPGAAARRLAATAIAAALGLDGATIAVVGRPPVAMCEGRPLDVAFSLSHHGRFVACAARLA
jgi:hypothetical protein